MHSTNNSDQLRANFKRARLLIIEDNDDYWLLIRKAISQVLPEITPLRVASQQQVNALLAEWIHDDWEIPKLVLLDLYLPERSQGLAVLETIRALDEPYNQLPVIMLSSSTKATDIREAYQRGASSYLVKPTTFSDWLSYFAELRQYWWETTILPSLQLNI